MEDDRQASGASLTKTAALAVKFNQACKFIAAWPVASGANRPYDLLGYLNAETAPVRSWRGAVIAFMARRAQEVGGNGLIVVGRNRQYVGSISNS